MHFNECSKCRRVSYAHHTHIHTLTHRHTLQVNPIEIPHYKLFTASLKISDLLFVLEGN